jgi:hypothetical protein
MEMSMSDEMRTPEASNPQPQQPAQQQQFLTDASAITTIYTNVCQCSVTPEELVLDFGLNPKMQQLPNEPVKLTHRIVMNFFTAKRLLGLLANVIQQHENAFGALELDFNRRMRAGRPMMPPPAPSK